GNDGGYASLHNFLRVRLTRIDHVIDNRTTAKIRARHFWQSCSLRLSRSHPSRMTVFRIRSKRFVIEIESKLSQLPELIRDIFAGVSHRAIGTYDDLIGLMLVRAGVRLKWHYPTTPIAAFAFEMDDAAFFHQLKRTLPKVQVQNFRLARQQIVTDAETFHRVENLLDVAGGDIVGKFSRGIVSFLNRMENF